MGSEKDPLNCREIMRWLFFVDFFTSMRSAPENMEQPVACQEFELILGQLHAIIICDFFPHFNFFLNPVLLEN